MKKVINYLGLRKVAINLQLDKLPSDVDQYIAEIAAEHQEELRQIDEAILVLSKATKQEEQLTYLYMVRLRYENALYTVLATDERI